MPKRNISKKMRGGIFGLFEGDKKNPNSQKSSWYDYLTGSDNSSTGSSWGSSDPVPPPVNNSYSPNSYSPNSYSPNSYSPNSYSPNNSYQFQEYVGGRRRRRRSHRMRGGYSDNVSMTNLASHAAPFSGATARPQAYVGGRRTKRRCHTHKRTHKRHCRK